MQEQEYLKERLNDQIDWYDSKSIKNQKEYKVIRITEVIISALIPILASYATSSIVVRLLIALGGATIAILIGIQGIYNFHENLINL